MNGGDQKQTLGIEVVLLALYDCKFEVNSVKSIFLEISPFDEVDIWICYTHNNSL
jgi:hypothetical protein